MTEISGFKNNFKPCQNSNDNIKSTIISKIDINLELSEIDSLSCKKISVKDLSDSVDSNSNSKKGSGDSCSKSIKDTGDSCFKSKKGRSDSCFKSKKVGVHSNFKSKKVSSDSCSKSIKGSVDTCFKSKKSSVDSNYMSIGSNRKLLINEDS